MRALTFTLLLLASYPAFAEDPQLLGAFDRACTNTVAPDEDDSFEAVLARLRAEGEVVQLDGGWSLSLGGGALQLRTTSGAGSMGPWVCQVVSPGARSRNLWREWLRLRAMRGHDNQQMVFIGESLSGSMAVEHRDTPAGGSFLPHRSSLYRASSSPPRPPGAPWRSRVRPRAGCAILAA